MIHLYINLMNLMTDFRAKCFINDHFEVMSDDVAWI